MFKNILKVFKATPPQESNDLDFDQLLGTEGGEELINSCSSCRWSNPKNPLTCEAFPKGIPNVILMGYLDHTVPFADEYLVYEPSLSTFIVSKKEALSFAELHPRYPTGTPKGGKFMPKGSHEYNAAIAKVKDKAPEKAKGTSGTTSESTGAPSKTPSATPPKLESNHDQAAQHVAADNKAKEPKEFSAHKFLEKTTTTSLEKRSSAELDTAGNAIAKKWLQPEHYAEFQKKIQELKDDVSAGKETFKQHSVTDPATGKRIYTPERLKAHNKILKDLFKNATDYAPKEGEQPEFVLAGGRGGAGKGHFKGVLGKYSDKTHLILDNDGVKEKMKDYDPEKAYLCHEEAGDILDKAIQQAKNMKLNTVIDATMRNTSPYIDDFKKLGYKTSIHFMHVNPETAVVRALQRWIHRDKTGNETKDDNGNIVRGRLVPPSVVLGMTSNEANFDKEKGKVDDWSFYRNDSPAKGVPPQLVADKKGGLAKKPKGITTQSIDKPVKKWYSTILKGYK